MKNNRQSLLAMMLLIASNIAIGATPFSCGKYGPNLTLSPNADLAVTATSQFGTPGVAMTANFVTQGGWFLLDSFGAGALMGCQPTQSYLANEGAARNNTYDTNGMLTQQVTTRDGGTPATLYMRYDTANPFRIVYAEHFCYGLVNTIINRFYFYYTDNKLTRMQIVPDSDCPIDGPVTVTYTYGSAEVPNMPTQEVIVEQDGDTATNTFTYNVSAGQLQSIATNFAGTFIYSYTDNLLSEIRWPSGDLSVRYRGETQWKSMRAGQFGWGLTIDYNDDNTVESTLQNTGCPSCSPSTYSY